MAGSFALSMRRQLAIVEGIKNNAEALAQAESGIALAESMLLIQDPAKRWRADGNVYQVDYANNQTGNGSKVRLRLLSETGKIDINMADQTLLKSVMTHAPVEEEQQAKLVGAIMDWRDPDDLLNINGAEKSEYKAAGLNYQPRNKPFKSIEELQMVLGINEEVYQWLEPLVTVHSRQLKVDVKLASKEVLQVLPDLDASMIESALQSRLDSAMNKMSASPNPEGVDPGGIVGQNQALTIVSEAQLENGSSALISVIVAQSQENPSSPFQVLKWQRSASVDMSLFTDEMSQLLIAEYAEPEFNN
ncbi:MAG: general secretion pathway protein GspK [Methylococcaceae bacterium]|nr:general secretion pathway protein GspK [Methylococcaceae bacterium]